MKRASISLLALGLLAILPGCRKEQPAPAGLQISIESPRPHQVFKKGELVAIRARLECPVQLHGYQVCITDPEHGDTLFAQSAHGHATTLQVAEDWVQSLERNAELELSISTTMSHEGQPESRSLRFKVQP